MLDKINAPNEIKSLLSYNFKHQEIAIEISDDPTNVFRQGLSSSTEGQYKVMERFYPSGKKRIQAFEAFRDGTLKADVSRGTLQDDVAYQNGVVLIYLEGNTSKKHPDAYLPIRWGYDKNDKIDIGFEGDIWPLMLQPNNYLLSELNYYIRKLLQEKGYFHGELETPFFGDDDVVFSRGGKNYTPEDFTEKDPPEHSVNEIESLLLSQLDPKDKKYEVPKNVKKIVFNNFDKTDSPFISFIRYDRSLTEEEALDLMIKKGLTYDDIRFRTDFRRGKFQRFGEIELEEQLAKYKDELPTDESIHMGVRFDDIKIPERFYGKFKNYMPSIVNRSNTENIHKIYKETKDKDHRMTITKKSSNLSCHSDLSKKEISSLNKLAENVKSNEEAFYLSNTMEHLYPSTKEKLEKEIDVDKLLTQSGREKLSYLYDSTRLADKAINRYIFGKK
jgi:hypothetical protein